MPNSLPGLCRTMIRPLQWLPPRMHAGGLAIMLNHLLADAIADGEMVFLKGRSVTVEITDLGLCFHLAFDGKVLSGASRAVRPDVLIRGDTHAFLLLATQREDADSLFFQRLLQVEGDTATGLHLKNFLDALDGSPLPMPARHALLRFTEFYERRCLPAAASADARDAA